MITHGTPVYEEGYLLVRKRQGRRCRDFTDVTKVYRRKETSIQGSSSKARSTYRHRFVSAPCLLLAITTLPLKKGSVVRRREVEGGQTEEGRRGTGTAGQEYDDERTCLQRPHWKASVSASCSPAPRVLNRFSAAIFASAAFRSSDAMSCQRATD